jgi:hypothetical protein
MKGHRKRCIPNFTGPKPIGVFQNTGRLGLFGFQGNWTL